MEDEVSTVFKSYGLYGKALKLVLEILKNKFEVEVIEPLLLDEGFWKE